jgi:hypothetical protein
VQVAAFAARYLATGSAVQAASDVGITARSRGALMVKASRMLKRARKEGHLERAVQAIETPSKMEAAEVIERLSRLARADLGEHLRYDEHDEAVGPKVMRGAGTYTVGEFEVIEEVRRRKDGEDEVSQVRRKIKVKDSLKALEALARIYGLDGTRSPEEPPITRMRAGFLALLADPQKREQLRALSLAALRAPIETTAVRVPPNGGGGNGHGT